MKPPSDRRFQYKPSRSRVIIPPRVAERAATRWSPGPTECRPSTYSLASHGYPQIGWVEAGRKYMVTAHRAAWVYAHGEQIPVGMTVDHMCKTKQCMNPNHMRLLTNFENARRTGGRDWPLGQCAHGHSNDLLFWDGFRWRCEPCAQATRDRSEAKRRARTSAGR